MRERGVGEWPWILVCHCLLRRTSPEHQMQSIFEIFQLEYDLHELWLLMFYHNMLMPIHAKRRNDQLQAHLRYIHTNRWLPCGMSIVVQAEWVDAENCKSRLPIRREGVRAETYHKNQIKAPPHTDTTHNIGVSFASESAFKWLSARFIRWKATHCVEIKPYSLRNNKSKKDCVCASEFSLVCSDFGERSTRLTMKNATGPMFAVFGRFFSRRRHATSNRQAYMGAVI